MLRPGAPDWTKACMSFPVGERLEMDSREVLDPPNPGLRGRVTRNLCGRATD